MIEVFLDTDICMVLEGDFPKQIGQLERGKKIEFFLLIAVTNRFNSFQNAIKLTVGCKRCFMKKK